MLPALHDRDDPSPSTLLAGDIRERDLLFTVSQPCVSSVTKLNMVTTNAKKEFNKKEGKSIFKRIPSWINSLTDLFINS
jgi:hypothetical protein